MKPTRRAVAVLILLVGGPVIAAAGYWHATMQTSSPVPATAAGSAARSKADEPHPLEPVLHMAREAVARLEQMHGYQCKFVKSERIAGTLKGPEAMRLKVRHEPFSVYTYCLGPANAVGEEAIYVAGQNDNNVLAHTTGLKHKIVGTLSLAPDSTLLMKDNLHPITEIGIKNLTQGLITSLESDMQFSECNVRIAPDTWNDQPVTRVEVEHPARREEFTYHRMVVLFDAELGIPLQSSRYGWPAGEGEEAPLTEQYSYEALELAPALDDTDFSSANPDYGFN